MLGLSELEAAPLRLAASAPTRNGERPHASLLGLSGLAPAPLPLRAPRPAGEESPGTTLLGLSGIPPRPLPGLSRARRAPAPRATASFFGLAAPAAAAEERSRSFFGMVLPADGAAPLPEPVEVPEFERDVTHQAERGFPIERAMLASLLAHAVLLLLLLVAPKTTAHDPRKGLLAALIPPEKTEEKIPLVFREAPGPKRENPKKSELSDADRRAGGGDRSKPKAASPYVPELPGMRGVAPGRPGVSRPFERPRVAEARPAAPAAGGAAAAPAPETKTAQNELEGFRVPPPAKREGAQGEKSLADINSVARQAAREVAGQGAISGQGGAGFPNPEGGFVDAGPISFETSWYDWGEYLQVMLAKIKAHWKPAMEPFRWKTTVQFAIHPDGTITDLVVVRPSANPAFTFGAQKAISTSNPLPPLPKDLLASVGSDHIEHVRIMFLFNFRTGDWEAPESAK